MKLETNIFGINIEIYRDYYKSEDNEFEYDNLFDYLIDYMKKKSSDIPNTF